MGDGRQEVKYLAYGFALVQHLPGPTQALRHAVHGHEQWHVELVIALFTTGFPKQLHLPEVGPVNDGANPVEPAAETLEPLA